MEWASLRQEELRHVWGQARAGAPLDPIEPLEWGRIMPRICEAKALSDDRIHLRFDDGSEGEADLSDLVGHGVFAAWSDPAVFAQVTIDPTTGTVSWPGDIDLCPDRLYYDLTGTSIPANLGTRGPVGPDSP